MDKYKETEGLLLTLIKELAKQKNLTQEDIANNMGIEKQNVNKILNHKYSPTLKVFLQLAEAVGCNFYIQSADDLTGFNQAFEKAMEEVGRRKPINRDN